MAGFSSQLKSFILQIIQIWKHFSGSVNGYFCRKWTLWLKFKFWMRLFAFCIMLIHLRNTLYSIQLWINSRADCALECWYGNQSRRRKTLLNSSSKIDQTYIQQLCEDTGCCPEDLPEAMNDREKWWESVRDIHATSTTWWWWI